MQSNEHQLEEDNHCLSSTGYILVITTWYAVAFSTARAYCWFIFSLLPTNISQDLFNRAATQPGSPLPGLVKRPLHSQRWGFVLMEFQKAPAGIFFQPAQVPLDSSPVLKPINCTPEYGINCKFDKTKPCCLLCIIDKVVKHNRSQDRSLWCSTCYSR